VKELPWNSLERIAQMMLPLPDPAEIKYYKPSFQGYQKLTLKVDETGFKYKIYIGEKLPNFVFIPEGPEIFQRLILRACVCPKGIEEFDVELTDTLKL